MIAPLDDSNAAKDYLQAALILKKDFNKQAETELKEMRKHGWSEKFIELASFMEKSGALEEVREGLNRSYCSNPPNPEKENAPSFPYVKAYRQLGDLLLAEGKKHEKQGDLASALESYMDALDFSQDFARDGHMADKISSAMVSHGAMENIPRVCAQLNSEITLEEALASLEELENRRVSAQDIFRNDLENIRYHLGRRLSRELFFNKSTLKRHDSWGELILYSSGKSHAEFKSVVRGNEPDWDQTASIFWGTFEGSHALITKELAMFRITRLVAALRLYEVRSGAYPDSSELLAPDIIDEIPVDPFDNIPIRYRLVDGMPIIYSVGPDLKDGKGEASYIRRTPTGDFVSLGDVAFDFSESRWLYRENLALKNPSKREIFRIFHCKAINPHDIIFPML
jgi:tetratricopeptide (TPR) repeat protein